MLPTTQVSDSITSLNGGEARRGTFSLRHIRDFPFDQYVQQLEAYQEQWRWFTGEALAVKGENDATKKYPAKINPIPNTVLKHAWAVFGQFSDKPGPLVRPRFFTDNETEQEQAKIAEKTLLQVWYENNGRTLQYENGILSQIYGGAFFKLRWDPEKVFYRKFGVWMDRVLPHEMVPIFDISNPWSLEGCWFVRRISAETAKKYIDIEPFQPKNPASEFYWIEYWDKKMYRIMVNGKLISFKNKEGEQVLAEHDHPFELTPIVYYPHIRAGNFFGINTFDHVKALVQEFNLLVGHVGDAIAQETHQVLWMKNVQGTPQWVNVGNGIKILKLDKGNNFAPGAGNEAAIDGVTRPTASSSMIDQLKFLLAQYRRDSAHPAVVDGEDEGSQRSSLTLLVRLLALTSHVDTERVFMTEGYNQVNRIALRMLEINDSANSLITPDHHLLQMWQKYPASIPTDRKQFIDEIAIRMAHKLGSHQHILSMFDDIENAEEMIAQIEAEILRKAELIRSQEEEEEEEEETPSPQPDNDNRDEEE